MARRIVVVAAVLAVAWGLSCGLPHTTGVKCETAGGCTGVRSDSGASDAGFDAGRDGGSDSGVDSGADAGIDAGSDAGLDAGPDGGFDGGI